MAYIFYGEKVALGKDELNEETGFCELVRGNLEGKGYCILCNKIKGWLDSLITKLLFHFS